MRGGATALLAASGVFMLMARPGHLPHGALWGMLLMGVAIAGTLHALGMLRAGADALPLPDTLFGPQPGELPWLSPGRAGLVATLVLVMLGPLVGFAGLPWVILAALGLLLPAALRRPGLLVFVGASALYLPILGNFGLWDPWETHYGEVAREMLARDDYISLWWAQDKWFWSKPILIFWAEALSWNASGVGFMPDSQFTHSEWPLRLPHYIAAMASLLAIYHTVARIFTPRAGLLSAVVLATTPYFGFITRQAVTDMPLVANLTIAVMLLLLAFVDDGKAQVRSYRLGPVQVSLRGVLFAMVLGLGLPQVLYLASRNVALVDGYLFAWHLDDFLTGSGFNPDVPGNTSIRTTQPKFRGWYVQPMAQALFWLVGLVAVLRMIAAERGVRALLMYGFYFFCGLSFMGKGLPGIALPGLVALLALVATQRWSLLLGGHLRVGAGILLLASISLPWFVAMFVRHGTRFTRRLLIHDHINRLTSGVHGDTGGVEYYIQQLGYGMFPWVVLVPLSLALFVGMRAVTEQAELSEVRRAQRDTAMIVGLWFAGTFTLFSAMTTKFHHYIFPAVPPLAILMGLTLDRLLGPQPLAPTTMGTRARLGWVLALCAPALLVAGAGGLFGDVRGVIPASVEGASMEYWIFQHGPPLWLCAVLIGAGLLLAVLSRVLRRPGDVGGEWATSLSAPIGGLLLVGALLCALAGRDLSWANHDKVLGPQRLIHLFVYNYSRDWPAHLDYRPVLSGFTVVAVALAVLCASRRLRTVLLPSLIGTALCFSIWLLDVYMLDLTPHWTQAGLVQRYYERRAGPHEPLVAWQMNWKGENYYTGNRVAVFQQLNNKKVKKWVDKHPGTRAYFVFEHKRLKRFKRMMKKHKITEVSTRRECNKFLLVRADIKAKDKGDG